MRAAAPVNRREASILSDEMRGVEVGLCDGRRWCLDEVAGMEREEREREREGVRLVRGLVPQAPRCHNMA